MASRSVLLRVGGTGLVLAVSACHDGATVDIAESGADVVFVVARPGTGKAACVTSLEVTPAEPVGSSPVWEVASPPRGVCAARFTYGHVPGGFSSGIPAASLVRGRKYHVDFSGTGFSGGATFATGDHDGPVSHD